MKISERTRSIAVQTCSLVAAWHLGGCRGDAPPLPVGLGGNLIVSAVAHAGWPGAPTWWTELDAAVNGIRGSTAHVAMVWLEVEGLLRRGWMP